MIVSRIEGIVTPWAGPLQLLKTFGGGKKPVFCREFPVRGMIERANKKRTSAPFGLKTANELLWDNGHSGGFTWSHNVYAGMGRADKKTVGDAQRNLRDKHRRHFYQHRGFRLVAYARCAAGRVNHSRRDQTWSVRPAAKAGGRGSYRSSGAR